MRVRKHLVALGVSVACVLSVFTGSALAAFPDYTGCPRSTPGVIACIDIQNTSGNLNIKGFNVPLGPSLEIRGGVSALEGEGNTFTPATGTNGFFSRPVRVPGGLLGIDWIPGNEVLATTELAGSASDIKINTGTQSVRIPVKVRLSNILLGMNCHIGSNGNPIVLNLITGTTSPPPPNRPISGNFGEPSISPEGTEIIVTGTRNVANEFAIPASSSCGLGLGLINLAVDLKLRLPSAAAGSSSR